MGKLIKYEIIGRYKFILGIAILMSIANIYLYTRIGVWKSHEVQFPSMLSFLTIFGCYVVAFVSQLGMFSKDLFEDTAYLKYTLPRKGIEITLSKLFTTVLETVFLGGISALFIFLFQKKIMGIEMEKILYDSISVNWLKLILLGILSLLVFISIVILVYFCITVTRITINGKKYGNVVAFILFIILVIVIGYLDNKIMELLPYHLDIPYNIFEFGSSNSYERITDDSINIASVIFNIVTFVSMLLGTAYLLDNKVDL